MMIARSDHSVDGNELENSQDSFPNSSLEGSLEEDRFHHEVEDHRQADASRHGVQGTVAGSPPPPPPTPLLHPHHQRLLQQHLIRDEQEQRMLASMMHHHHHQNQHQHLEEDSQVEEIGEHQSKDGAGAHLPQKRGRMMMSTHFDGYGSHSTSGQVGRRNDTMDDPEMASKKPKRTCSKYGCNNPANRKRCKEHVGLCLFKDCMKGKQKSDFCIQHGGKRGHRCSFEGCKKFARAPTDKCVEHGGGRRCAVEGCQKSAVSPTDRCIRHGGGRRCDFSGCHKSAIGSNNFCTEHLNLIVNN